MIDASEQHDSCERPRFALAHDWLCGYRGGEAVLERIAGLLRGMGEVDRVYTMFDEGRSIAPEIDRLRRTVSPLGALPARARRWLLPAYPRAVGWLSGRLAERQREAPVAMLISTSSAAIKGMRAPPRVPHLCYCHAPARYVWSIPDEYSAGGGVAGAARRTGLGLLGGSFKRWDRASAAYVTRFVANSSHTAAEIARCFGRESEVIHPPVRTEWFTPSSAAERGAEWLLVTALEPYKRVDLAIEAARLAGAELTVAGTGSLEKALRREHGRTGVRLLGRVSDAELRDLYRRARLLLYPQIEDFGITAVEAQACGCPVVARGAGGALDSVVDGVTGRFFKAPTAASLAAAAADCPSAPAACRANAERFSEAAFDRRMMRVIEGMLGRS